jgi:death-on-curing protein
MRRLTVHQIQALHRDMVCETGGSDGIRDVGLLESAVHAPFQTFDNEPLYPSIQMKAARLDYALINNHPFVDGNKRTGVHAMLVFLEMNGVELDYSQDDLVSVGLGIASGSVSAQDILSWIINHQV